MEHSDPEDVETFYDAEQLHRVSCTDCRSSTVDSDRSLQETVENVYTDLSESITISSALEIVPPPHNVEPTKSSLATEPAQVAPVFLFNSTPTPLSHPTGGSQTSISKKAKRKKDINV